MDKVKRERSLLPSDEVNHTGHLDSLYKEKAHGHGRLMWTYRRKCGRGRGLEKGTFGSGFGFGFLMMKGVSQVGQTTGSRPKS